MAYWDSVIQFPEMKDSEKRVVYWQELISDGYYGTVHKVSNFQGCFFAFKITDGQPKFQPREFYISQYLPKHPNLQEIYGFKQIVYNESPLDYVLMEFIDGKTLSKCKEISKEQMFNWNSTILKTILFCLNHHVMPGDMSKDNIMITQ